MVHHEMNVGSVHGFVAQCVNELDPTCGEHASACIVVLVLMPDHGFGEVILGHPFGATSFWRKKMDGGTSTKTCGRVMRHLFFVCRRVDGLGAERCQAMLRRCPGRDINARL
jgi:hypothetical protein